MGSLRNLNLAAPFGMHHRRIRAGNGLLRRCIPASRCLLYRTMAPAGNVMIDFRFRFTHRLLPYPL